MVEFDDIKDSHVDEVPDDAILSIARCVLPLAKLFYEEQDTEPAPQSPSSLLHHT